MAAIIDQETKGNTYPIITHYEEFDVYPLSDSLVPLSILVVVFLAYVIKIGPDHMRNRPPFKLKYTILVYNAFQVLFSLLFVIMSGRVILRVGLFPSTSPQFDPEIRHEMFIAIYLYNLGKITELLDTIFFVLRKKDNQLTFLHIYHHSSVIIGTWMMLFYGLTMSSIYGSFINSLVHVVMYFYYFMAALGPQYQKYLTWKKYITTFQLVQFVSMFIHQSLSFVLTKGEHPLLSGVYILYSAALFFKLFSNFYNSSYKPKEGKTIEANGKAKEQ